MIPSEAVGSSRTGEDREAEALIAQIAQLRARIEGLPAERASARAAAEAEEIASLRERIAIAKSFVAKQTGTAVSVEQRARRVRLLTGITLSVVGIGLVIALRMMLATGDPAESEGLGWFYLVFGLPLIMGVTLVLQSRYSTFRNGSLDPEDDS